VSYFFYAIQSLRNNSLYKGISLNPAKRLLEHNSEKNISTKHLVPYKLIYIEKCVNRAEARKREKYFKSGSGREKLKLMLK